MLTDPIINPKQTDWIFNQEDWFGSVTCSPLVCTFSDTLSAQELYSKATKKKTLNWICTLLEKEQHLRDIYIYIKKKTYKVKNK